MTNSSSLKLPFALSLIAVLAGLTLSVLGMVDFMFYLKSLPAFVAMAFFFVTSLLSLIIVLRRDRTSGIMFLLIMILYCVALLATGVLIPLAIWPGAILKCSVVALSAIVFIGLLAFTFNWRNVKKAKRLITTLVIIELVIAVATVAGYYQATFADTRLILFSAFLRPITLGAVALAYTYHMKARHYN